MIASAFGCIDAGSSTTPDIRPVAGIQELAPDDVREMLRVNVEGVSHSRASRRGT